MPKPKNPATEVVASTENDRRQRRKFSAEKKEQLLAEADACTKRGELGKLLRRERIYSSQLTDWRRQQAESGRAGLERQRPGRKPSKTAEQQTIERLEREKAALEKENRIQRKLLELSGKAHEILGLALPRIEESDETPESGSSSSATKRSR